MAHASKNRWRLRRRQRRLCVVWWLAFVCLYGSDNNVDVFIIIISSVVACENDSVCRTTSRTHISYNISRNILCKILLLYGHIINGGDGWRCCGFADFSKNAGAPPAIVVLRLVVPTDRSAYFFGVNVVCRFQSRST